MMLAAIGFSHQPIQAYGAMARHAAAGQAAPSTAGSEGLLSGLRRAAKQADGAAMAPLLEQASLAALRQERAASGKNAAGSAGLAAAQAARRAEQAEKIRNREIPCPTCQQRQYQDESDDHGVSYQSATHIPQSQAGTRVLSHEQEHVNNNREENAGQEVITNSIVTLQYDTCPECGRRYVAGGQTRTSALPKLGQEEQQQGAGEQATGSAPAAARAPLLDYRPGRLNLQV